MAKEKKGGKRLNKKQMAEMLEQFFTSQPDKTLSFKEILRQLKLNTHPQKMLAIDTMEEMAWDDFLSRVSDTSYKLNTSGQVQEGIFRRKANGKNSFIPDDGGKPAFVAERNSMFALDGDRVRVSFNARRPASNNSRRLPAVKRQTIHCRPSAVSSLLLRTCLPLKADGHVLSVPCRTRGVVAGEE